MSRKFTAAWFENVIALRRKLSFLNMKKRDKEPSRIPVKRILSLLKNKLRKTGVRYFVMLSIPNSSFIAHLCKITNCGSCITTQIIFIASMFLFLKSRNLSY